MSKYESMSTSPGSEYKLQHNEHVKKSIPSAPASRREPAAICGPPLPLRASEPLCSAVPQPRAAHRDALRRLPHGATPGALPSWPGLVETVPAKAQPGWGKPRGPRRHCYTSWAALAARGGILGAGERERGVSRTFPWPRPLGPAAGGS